VAHAHVGFIDQTLLVDEKVVCKSVGNYHDALLFNISVCKWSYDNALRVYPGMLLTTISRYNSTHGHWGVMSHWQGMTTDE
jgi:hypothetical protein